MINQEQCIWLNLVIAHEPFSVYLKFSWDHYYYVISLNKSWGLKSIVTRNSWLTIYEQQTNFSQNNSTCNYSNYTNVILKKPDWYNIYPSCSGAISQCKNILLKWPHVPSLLVLYYRKCRNEAVVGRRKWRMGYCCWCRREIVLSNRSFYVVFSFSVSYSTLQWSITLRYESNLNFGPLRKHQIFHRMVSP